MHEIDHQPMSARAHLGTEPAMAPIGRESGRGILAVTAALALVSIAAIVAAVIAL